MMTQARIGREPTGDGLSDLARLIAYPAHSDERGTLLPLAFDALPFVPRRVFTVAGVVAGTVRGGHSHHAGEQLLVCVQGRVEALMRRNQEEARSILVPGGPGLLLGPGVWCSQTYLEAGSVLLVLASEPYDPASYIRTWESTRHDEA